MKTKIDFAVPPTTKLVYKYLVNATKVVDTKLPLVKEDKSFYYETEEELKLTVTLLAKSIVLSVTDLRDDVNTTWSIPLPCLYDKVKDGYEAKIDQWFDQIAECIDKTSLEEFNYIVYKLCGQARLACLAYMGVTLAS